MQLLGLIHGRGDRNQANPQQARSTLPESQSTYRADVCMHTLFKFGENNASDLMHYFLDASNLRHEGELHHI